MGRIRAVGEPETSEAGGDGQGVSSSSGPDVESGVAAYEEVHERQQRLKKAVKDAAAFGPSAKKPAQPGSVLYQVFEVQALLGAVAGGLAAFNLIWPSDEPSVARLLGMWSIWMWTIPSLRARQCPQEEKEALNYAFLLVPITNILIPFAVKSFSAIYVADVAITLALYKWKVWK